MFESQSSKLSGISTEVACFDIILASVRRSREVVPRLDARRIERHGDGLRRRRDPAGAAAIDDCDAVLRQEPRVAVPQASRSQAGQLDAPNFVYSNT